MGRQQGLRLAGGQYLPGCGQCRQFLGGTQTIAAHLAMVLACRAVRKTDAQRQLYSANRRQVSNAVLHGDRRLTRIVGVVEKRRQVVATRPHDVTVQGVDTASHALDAPVNGVQRLGSSQLVV
jgi:hypothetical protein